MWENAQAIELWIKNLGKSHSTLVKENVIPALPMKRLYENSLSLEIEPCKGIELSFWFETQRFEVMNITLISQDQSKAPSYTGELPSPYDGLCTRNDVRTRLGVPFKVNEAMSWELDGVQHRIGGWDFYELDETINPNCQIEFQYDDKLNVALLSFSVFDRES